MQKRAAEIFSTAASAILILDIRIICSANGERFQDAQSGVMKESTYEM